MNLDQLFALTLAWVFRVTALVCVVIVMAGVIGRIGIWTFCAVRDVWNQRGEQ